MGKATPEGAHGRSLGKLGTRQGRGWTGQDGTSWDPAQLGEVLSGAGKPVLPSSWWRVAGRTGNFPFSKLEVRAEGRRHWSSSLDLLMGKGETEAQRGEGPFPGSHSGFPFCLHSANLAHCKVFVPCPSRRSRLWEGKLAQRREGPARQGCAGLSSLLWLPPRPVSSHLSRS